MKNTFWSCLLGLLLFSSANCWAWESSWIAAKNCQNKVNTWQVFRKNFSLSQCPQQLIAKISTDSKYWLWINGQMVVFEGELKRGPMPKGIYYDEVDIAPYLKKGDNLIAIQTVFFGKEGFSHKNSGWAGLLFEAIGSGLQILSNDTWEADVYEAYGTCTVDTPNYRLPESAIQFDGRKTLGNWYSPKSQKHFPKAIIVDNQAENDKWGKLVARPVPLFKYSKLLKYVSQSYDPKTRILTCKLPYDAQVTPWIKCKASAGKTIDMRTDCFVKPGEKSVRGEYITHNGVQEYESLEWMNGNQVEYTIPEGVEVLDVRYRESGYDTDIAGTFECDDPFWNELWKRSARTLYLNMRDNYFDCPDRERAQWWGDMVNDIHENFYVLTPSSWKLIRKGMYELFNWQRPNGVIHSPIPAGNYDTELPCQMLMTLSTYGFYSHYFYSGDSSFVAPLYDGIHKYLHEVWKTDDKGLVPIRKGDWSWADWGTNIDLHLITNEWYYLALKAEREFAKMNGNKSDVKTIGDMLDKMEQNFNDYFWTADGYRSPNYKGQTDDRAQALAVLCQFATKDKYPQLLSIFQKNHFASPLLEMYVQEAMFQMGYGEEALKRAKQQYSNMMSFKNETTVFEFWDYKGSGGTNHAWASSMTVIMGRHVCGIRPTTPGFKTFEIAPDLSGIKQVKTSLETQFGTIAVQLQLQANGCLKAKVVVPQATTAVFKWNDQQVELTPGKHNITL